MENGPSMVHGFAPIEIDDRAGFVGREDALEVLGWALEESRAQRSAIVVVEGPRGVGKSRLVREAETRSKDVRFVTVSLPETTPNTFEQEASRVMADRELLVVEDIDRANDSALEILKSVAHRAAHVPLTLLVTLRPNADETYSWLRDFPFARELLLKPFSKKETAQFARAVAGRPLSQTIIDQLHQKTSGYPLSLAELAHVLHPYENSNADVHALYHPLPENERRRLHGTIDAQLMAYVGDADEQ